MSWMKRRGQPTTPNPSSAAPPPPPVQMYNPNQQIQTQWSETQAQANNWPIPNKQGQHQTSYAQSNFPQSSQQTNYWQQSHNQQTASYNQNTNQYNQQFPQYNQLSTGFYENNTYQHQTYPAQQSNNPTYNYGNTVSNHIDKQSQPDTWSWGWGDEDNSNVQNFSLDGSNINSRSNTITDSFVSDEAWNWSVEDPSNTNLASSISNKNNTETHATISNINLEAKQIIPNIETNQDSLFPKMGKLAEKHNIPDMKNNSGQTTNSNTFRNSENPSPNQTLSMTSLKHNKSENLISQCSTESQISSQDSSDLLHTSESDKSHVLSRSSTISESPISGHDLNSGIFMTNRHEAVQSQLFNTQTESENTGRNVPSSCSNFYLHDNYNLQLENKEVLPYDSRSGMHPTPPPPILNQTPPLSSGGEDLKNSYKRTTGLSHKAANKYVSEGTTSTQTISGNTYNQSVNLETLPDNSEQPDSFPQQNLSRKLSSNKPLLQQWSENSEIAPINDRNQYLETGQLSNIDFVSINQSNQADNFDAFPPPGFTRMVLGQMEHSANNSRGYEEPPPGLSRMVLGQTETTPLRNDVNELPVGLHRMIPGESSSPEAARQGRGYQKPTYPDGVASESEPNQLVTSQVRSATIGADTPPVTGTTNTAGNRSETIGADISESYNSTTNLDNKKMNSQATNISSRYNNNVRDTNADGANNLDESIVNPIVSNRRAFIEGQPPDTDNKMNNLVNAVRDLTVGENPTDIQTSTLPLLERSTRRSSRQESTDSEQEHENRSKISKERKDKRYNDKLEHYGKEKHRYTYSPLLEHYKDKRHDRRRYKNGSRYDDDTDGYSDREKDKRRDDRDRREDFERKYSSLKKDKEKERKHREQKSHHEYSRDSRRHEHYNRYDDNYDDHNRSRPSSRSDSMHESYRLERDRHRDRDKDRRRRHRDPFNPYLQGYTYDPYNPYYQQYQYHYYENLRRTNPQAYAEWYHKYYQQSGIQQGYGNEDRASVHSGRSSANDELAKDRYTHQSFYSQARLNYYREAYTHSISGHYGLDESRPFEQTSTSLYQDGTTVTSQRLTPAKFATAHIKASIASGVLVKIFPHYPLDGQAAMVEVSNLHEMLSNNEEYKDLVEFPGPLVKGVTHKKTIIEFCENKIRNAINNRNMSDVDSYILMWELLILLLRQNGMVVGTDIAELLMKHRKQLSSRTSVVSNSSSAVAETTEANNIVSENNSTSSILKEEIVTNKFRDYLIYGSEKEALEWAMKHGLWGHALFLASKLDKRTYANVMTRFANGLPISDPLQTLYQLLSGKVPSAVTSVADEKWGDWRPHLAMILSNTTQRPELDRKSITTLADTLFNRGSLYAAQFCYLMAQVGFSRYGSDGAKLVLLGSNHNKPFLEFASNEAIHMTEIYEYACSLNDAGFIIPEFQPYKYLIATKLADYGLLEKALAYLEKITLAILQNPSLAQSSLITQVCQLADRLKFCDSVDADFEGDGELEISRPDNSWLRDLKQLEKDYSMGLLRTDDVDNYASQTPEIEPSQIDNSLYEQAPQEIWQHQYTGQQQWQSAQYADQQPLQTDYQTKQQDAYASDQHQDQQKYWLNQQQWNENQSSTNLDANNQLQDNILQSNQTDYWNSVHSQQEEVVKQPVEDVLQPQISMPNQLKGLSTLNEEQDNSHTTQAKKELAVAPKIKQQNKPATTGWFGGIWNKLSLRPKNQMKLPDDKNPTIVWDENKKRWINLEAEADGTVAELKPPPKMSEMLSNKQQPNNSLNQQFNFQNQSFNTQPQTLDFQQNVNNIPLANDPNTASQVKTNYTQQTVSNNNNNEETIPQLKPTQPNMFKLQRNRNIKKAYVDVFNPGAKNSNMGTVPVPDTYGTISNNNPQMNFFIPAPVTDPNVPTDFLTPAPVYHSEDNTQKHPHKQ